MSETPRIRGDKLRELVLIVGLKDKYGTSLSKSDLRRVVGYKRGGAIYDSLERSGHFIINGDNISLSDKGEKYFKKVLMSPFRFISSIGFFINILGLIILAEWILPTFFNIFIVINSPLPGLAIIFIGFFLEFGLLPVYYKIAIKKRK